MAITLLKLLPLICILYALASTFTYAFPVGLHKRELQQRKLPQPLISGWVAAWKGLTGVHMYEEYDELSFFTSVIDKTNLSVAWSVDGDPTTTFPPGHINDKQSEKQPILLSIGGWSGSMNFSQAVATKDKRAALAQAITEIVVANKLSGVDLDWEFPNAVGKFDKDFPGDVGGMCNQHSPEDTENLCIFIDVLRAYLSKGMLAAGMKYKPILAAAVPFSGFRDEKGQPLKNAYHFVQEGALDYISIMAYEMGHAYRTHSGIHAPWDLGEKTPEDQQWSIRRSIEYWTGAGVPADKIQVGLATYGKTFNTSVAKNTAEPPKTDFGSPLYQEQKLPEMLEEPPAGWEDKWDNPLNAIWGREYCDIKRVRKRTQGLSFNETIEAGIITPEGDKAGPGWKYFWDKTTLSPYLWNSETSQMISYDSPNSIGAKVKKLAEFRDANGKQLLGIKMFHVQGDSNSLLVKAARAAWK